MNPKNWYRECGDAIRKEFGGDADLFIDLLAATSPRKQVSANWRLAMRIYHVWQHNPYYRNAKLVDAARYNEWLDNLLAGVMKTHRPNVLRALRREPLSGNKVRAFAANLKGDLEPVTIDVWVCRYFGWATGMTDKRYKKREAYIQSYARARHMKPAEYQAEIWYAAIKKYGKNPKSYLSVKDRNQKFFEFYFGG